MSSLTLAQEGDSGKKTGFEQGKHKGHENERNPWHDFNQDESGVDFELTIHNHAIMPTVTFSATYNSLMTIQEVLADVLDGATDGFYLQECFEELDIIQGTISDCTEGESPTPLDSSLTLEEAGIVDDPEVHLVHVPG